MIEYRITSYNTDYLRELWKDNWILSTIHDNKMFFYREIKVCRKSRQPTTETLEFVQFYTLYPKKKAPQSALKAWHNLSKTDQDKVLEVLPYHISYWKFKYWKTMVKWKEKIKDDTFIPYPASWLNSGAYKDEWLEVDGKSFDDLRQEKATLEKRHKEEEEREKKVKEERELADDVTLTITRLKEQWFWTWILDELRKQNPSDMPYTIDIKARWLVSKDLNHFKSKLKF